ncbi:unnamed protein product [Rhizophagus irregularis]|nr:unnamed protein product [Rhizophagus irregularis]
MANTSANDPNSDDNFSDTSGVTDYFKEEEGTNESTEEVSKKSEVSAPTMPIPAEDNSNEEDWFDEEAFFKETNPTTVTPNDDMYFNETNDANTHDGSSNSCNNDSDPDSNSEDEMPDDSDDDGYNGYGGYNEYGECDRGYYYRDGRYERKTSPMMSPIISLVTA